MKIKILLISLFVFLVISCSPKYTEEDLIKLYLTALNFYSNEELEESKEYINMILQQDKNFYQAEFLLGKINFFQDNLINSKNIFYKLQRKYPEYIESKIWYIMTLILLKEYNQAQIVLDKSLSFNQTDWRIYYLYSLLETYRENYDKKIAYLKQAEECLRDSTKVYNELSQIYNFFELDNISSDYKLKEKTIESE